MDDQSNPEPIEEGRYYTNFDLSYFYPRVYKYGGYFGSCFYCGVPAPEKVYRNEYEHKYWICPSCGEAGISFHTDRDGRSILDTQGRNLMIDGKEVGKLQLQDIAKIGGIIVIAVFVLFVVFNSCRSCADLCEGKGRACMETCTEERYDDAWRYGS